MRRVGTWGDCSDQLRLESRSPLRLARQHDRCPHAARDVPTNEEFAWGLRGVVGSLWGRFPIVLSCARARDRANRNSLTAVPTSPQPEATTSQRSSTLQLQPDLAVGPQRIHAIPRSSRPRHCSRGVACCVAWATACGRNDSIVTGRRLAPTRIRHLACNSRTCRTPSSSTVECTAAHLGSPAGRHRLGEWRL